MNYPAILSMHTKSEYYLSAVICYTFKEGNSKK